ncbi:MAG: glyoxalase [Rhodobacterales bacterium]|nr:glyoxalase [Rhodobacterales bacterium]
MHAFHLAFPIRDIASTRAFYVDLLGATQGRSADRWIDFDFWGHQISAHVTEPASVVTRNEVDGKRVPVRHFGVILPWGEFWKLAHRLEKAGITFIIAPYIRFEGEAGEQATMFFLDPSENALEFKSFQDPTQVFARESGRTTAETAAS